MNNMKFNHTVNNMKKIFWIGSCTDVDCLQ